MGFVPIPINLELSSSKIDFGSITDDSVIKDEATQIAKLNFKAQFLYIDHNFQ